MASVFGNSNFANYFSQMMSNQLLQNQLSTTVAQTQGNSNNAIQQNNQANAQLGNALNSLASLINSSSTSKTATTQLSALDNYTINNLVSQGSVDKTKLNNLIDMITNNTGDFLYTRTASNDPNITAKNKVAISGADLSSLLNQAALVSQRGEDVNAYVDAATEVAQKGDYDDLKRFINVTNSVMKSSQNLNQYYDFSKQILNKRSYDFESNVFALQSLVNHGTSMDNAVAVLKNMTTTGLEGRNNLVDLQRVLVNEKNKGSSVSNLISNMVNSNDTRAFMNTYMANNGLKSTAPDFNKFDRIERIDGEDMIITEGESAALFAQAVSQSQGLLPESVLYWSSLQTGAIANGSSYLDLSKLQAGTYDIYVKIGNYAGGTDTAKKRVVVLPKDDVYVDGEDDDNHEVENDEHDDHEVENHENDHEEVKTEKECHEEDNHKEVKDNEHENNGLGDQKDTDNEVKGTDESNPGHNKETEEKKTTSPVLTSKKEGEYSVLPDYKASESNKKKELDDSDFEFLFKSTSINENIIKTLSNFDTPLSEKYKKKEISLIEILFDTTYKRQKEELSRSLKLAISKKEAESFCNNNNIDENQTKLFLNSFECDSNVQQVVSVEQNPERK